MDNILEEVNRVFRLVFHKNDIIISADTTAGDIPGWDSLTHMALIAAIEEHFRILFSFEEVREFKNVGDLVHLIRQKSGQ